MQLQTARKIIKEKAPEGKLKVVNVLEKMRNNGDLSADQYYILLREYEKGEI